MFNGKIVKQITRADARSKTIYFELTDEVIKYLDNPHLSEKYLSFMTKHGGLNSNNPYYTGKNDIEREAELVGIDVNDVYAYQEKAKEIKQEIYDAVKIVMDEYDVADIITYVSCTIMTDTFNTVSNVGFGTKGTKQEENRSKFRDFFDMAVETLKDNV